ncbi:hypothetical protein DYB32_007695 [Aphanomyces invadans]|uniref:Uncharacterized protein n=1 Tax=Aphanomyces invadans TaxID=157072 RepID=A0A418AN61_9STRA|nr:hypothetical protein DYB32_007695 [Aphanomyces invadans]
MCEALPLSSLHIFSRSSRQNMQEESQALLAKAPPQRASTVPIVRQMSSLAENTNQANVNKHVEVVLTTVGVDPADTFTGSFVYSLVVLIIAVPLFLGPRSITWHWVALMTPYYLVALMQGNCAAFANVGQVVLIATKLDGTLSWSWNGVFFPYWIGVVVGVVLAPLGVYAATKYSMAQASIDDEQPPSLFWPVVGAISSFVLAVATFSPFLLLMYKLNWGELATVVVFIPYFVVLTLVFLVVRVNFAWIRSL